MDVVDEVLAKLATRKYSIKCFVGRGSGRIAGKCSAWARVLHEQGCSRLIIVHDLDSGHLPTLRERLITSLGECPMSRHVLVIPIREIEAWLLADEAAVGKVAKPRRPARAIPNPERLMRPKEFLRDWLSRLSDQRIVYINTIHNRRIANYASLNRLHRCASFRPLENFAANNLQ